MYICKICNRKFLSLSKHIFRSHKIYIDEYLKKYELIDVVSLYFEGFSAFEISKKIKAENMGLTPGKEGILKILKKYEIIRRNTSEAIKIWSKKRGGPWNKGLTKKDHPSIKKYADSRKGKNNPYFRMSEEKKEKMASFSFACFCKGWCSSGEKRIKEILINANIPFVHHKRIKIYELDFLLLEKNVAIEFNGSYWHCDPRIYDENFIVKKGRKDAKLAKNVWEHDERKKDVVEKEGIKILYIWEKEYKEMDDKQFENYVLGKINEIIKD
ncbi:hypothetical protein M0R19_03990 [Candidatus Pacearchaeota archaeon]|jgi:G:T-mismatch repair DNA endonuclease (very short patch repair protein)|nr:hypothetical protein [Candidatus Pacearchaeota archaeon]